MEFVLGGTTLRMNDLSPELDNEFRTLYVTWAKGALVRYAAFEPAALAYFEANPTPGGAHDKYFENFTIIWRSFLGSMNHLAAEEVWRLAIEPALKWERAAGGRRVHKGVAYYFWGMTAIVRGDLERGYALIHQALDEDVETSGVPRPGTPAFAFATLRYEQTDHAFWDWTRILAGMLDSLLDEYRRRFSRTLDLAEFKQRFMEKPANLDTAVLLAFILGRLYQIGQIPENALKNGFAGGLEMNALFDVTTIIETALREKSATNGTFYAQAKFFAKAAGLPLDGSSLKEINRRFQADFDHTLTQALDGRLTLDNKTTVSGLAAAVAVAYGIRNRGAHHTTFSKVMWTRWPEVRSHVYATLFLIVETLYS